MVKMNKLTLKVIRECKMFSYETIKELEHLDRKELERVLSFIDRMDRTSFKISLIGDKLELVEHQVYDDFQAYDAVIVKAKFVGQSPRPGRCGVTWTEGDIYVMEGITKLGTCYIFNCAEHISKILLDISATYEVHHD
jgi:hypothetical protein